MEIDVIKSLEVDESYGVGNNGEIKDVTFGLYAAEELTAADGSSIPADRAVNQFVFNGFSLVGCDMHNGCFLPCILKINRIFLVTYKISGVCFNFLHIVAANRQVADCLSVTKGYVLSEEEISVTISEVDEVVEVELVNYFITGNIALTKVDKDYPDNKLTGAVFEVYLDTNEDGKLDKKDGLLGEMGEVEKGVYQMDDLRYGKYLVREKTAPTGFVLDENVYPVSIEENGKTYNAEN